MNKSQVLAQLNARCVGGTGIFTELEGTEQYDPNNTAQTNLGGVVTKYSFYGLFPAGKYTAERLGKVTVLVFDDNGANEEALIERGDLDGIFRGEIQEYLETQSFAKDWQVTKTNIVEGTATIKAAVVNGNDREIKEYFLEKTAPNTFSAFEIINGSWDPS